MYNVYMSHDKMWKLLFRHSDFERIGDENNNDVKNSDNKYIYNTKNYYELDNKKCINQETGNLKKNSQIPLVVSRSI